MQSKKNILIDIGHPAQVYQFKHIYIKLKNSGHNVLFTAKDKEITIYLLDQYNIPYKNIGKPKKGLLNKIGNIPASCIEFYKIVKNFKPDIVLSRFSFHTSWVCSFLNIKHIGFTDTEHVGLADTLTIPFVDTKLTAYSYKKDLGKNHIRYSGNIELFYLHPNSFSPDDSVLDLLGVDKNDKYVIIRFVSWDAHHDVGQNGITLKNKIKLVRDLSKYAEVFITSEEKLPHNLAKYKISIPPEKMHDSIYFSSLLVGESATMSSEAAVLGVPSIYIDEVGRGYTDVEGDYGLVYNYHPKNQIQGINKAIEIIKTNNYDIYNSRKDTFLKNKIDPSKFTFWFIENYPKSIFKLKENKHFQYQFK